MLLGVAIVTVMLTVIESGERSVQPKWWLVGVGLMMLVLFGVWEWWLEKRGGHPLVKLKLLALRGFSTSVLTAFCFFAGFPVVFTIANLYYQQGLHYSAFQAAMAVMTFAVGSSIGSLRGGPTAHRYGGLQVVFGALTCGVGLGVVTFLAGNWTGADTAVVLAAPLLIAGIGAGFVFAANQTLAVEEIPRSEASTVRLAEPIAR